MNNWIFWQRFPEIRAATTTRQGGVSSDLYEGLNLAYQTGDDHKKVSLNRSVFLNEAHLRAEQLVLCHQTHADTIRYVTSKDGGAGADSFESGVQGTDSLYTDIPNLALGILHADCVPVFFYVPRLHLIGIIHAGWQGTIKQVVYLTLKQLMNVHSFTADEIYLYLGPSINGRHQLLWDEIAAAGIGVPHFNDCLSTRDGQTYYDVVTHNLLQLNDLKIKRDHIDVSPYSTYEEASLFYSFARSLPAKTGRHISFIYRVDE